MYFRSATIGAGVETLLERFKPRIDPASQLRLVRMRGRKQLDFETLERFRRLAKRARMAGTQCVPPPELRFEPDAPGAGAD